MSSIYLTTPSYILLIITGFLITCLVTLAIIKSNDVFHFTTYQKLTLVCALTICLSAHGNLYMDFERQYNINPYTGKKII
jgi:hypothetical protein